MALAVFPQQSNEIFSFGVNLGCPKLKPVPKSKAEFSVILAPSVGV